MKKHNLNIGSIRILLFLLLLLSSCTLLYKSFGNRLERDISFNYNDLYTFKKDIQPKLIEKRYPLPSSLHIPILLYHYVEIVADRNDIIRQSLNIPPYILENQIQTLKNAGYTFVTLKDISNMLKGNIPIPPNPIVLSFDDGYRDFYTDAFPILQRNKVKAVAYIAPGLLDRQNYMFTWQVSDIAKNNLIEIGAHTVDHAMLRGLPIDAVKKEIVESKELLEKYFHISIESFAYPYGSFDDQTIQVVKQAGFDTAVSTITGTVITTKNRYTLYRLHQGILTGEALLNFLNET